jgi:hypothetical protein
MAKTYSCYNGLGLTTTGAVKVTTGAATLKTMIQLLASASSEARIVEWWWEGDASAAATPAVVELMFHSTGAATVTAYTAATDFKKYDPNSRASLLTVGTAGSGFTASGEGTPATALGAFSHLIPPTSGMYFQYPLGREPEMAVSTFARLRQTVPATVNVLCGIAWEE